jgi:RNA polymerase sigma factor (sigma-70 family)
MAGTASAGPLWQVLSQSGISPLSAADQNHRLNEVMAGLGQLKAEHREVITLAFFDQLPTREIGERMSITPAAASMLLIRAVKTLRRDLTGVSKILEQTDARPR